MPRGPGKKENYNFDYSRFNGGVEQEDQNVGDDAIPADMLRQLPGELQEAFRLMQVAKQTGDMRAQERANELALKAVERGGPEMKQRFQQELMRQAAQVPEAKKSLEALLNNSAPVASPARAAGRIKSDDLLGSADRMGDLSASITQMHEKMKAGADEAARQMESLKRQQEALEQMKGPEDFERFMTGQGLTQEDVQRALAGDEDHMKKCIEKALGKSDEQAKQKTEQLDSLMGAVDQIHKSLVSDTPDSSAPARTAPAAPVAAPVARAPEAPAGPAPSIPEHRVQYQKDAEGRLLQVELRCELPGIQSMDDIEVDVSEKYLRLRTNLPAYVVNVGPFPALVDAPAARAKFSKKRQELTLSVPAKP